MGAVQPASNELRIVGRLRPRDSDVRVPGPDDTDEVICDGLTYHDPDEMPVGQRGERIPEFAAFHDRGAVPCSACFDDQSGAAYPFPYLDPVSYFEQ